MSASQYRKHRVQQAREREQAHLESLLQTVLEECRNLQRNQALLHEKLDQVSGHVNQLRLRRLRALAGLRRLRGGQTLLDKEMD